MPEALAPLSFAVHSMPSPAELTSEEARRTASGRLKMLLVLLVCAAPVLASYLTYFVVRPGARTNYSELVEPPRPLPADLPLTRLDGRAVPAASLKGQWLLVVVAGGACDAGCEQALWLQRQLREALGRDKDRVDKLWLIDDAAMPRPETLAAVASGTPATVLRVPRAALDAWLAPSPSAAAPSPSAASPVRMAIVDPRGDWMMRVPNDPDPARLKRDMDRLLRASEGWDRPGR